MHEQEIIDLHQFFEDWFNGRLPDTKANFSRFTDTMDADFHIISPTGALTPRTPLLNGLRGLHNARQGVRIWIDNVEVRSQRGDISIVTYEEWQQSPDTAARGRLSTVVFIADATQPNGLRWLHVHETWLPVNET